MATRMQRNTQQQRGGMRGGGIRGRVQSAVSGRRQSRRGAMGDGEKFGVDNLTYDLVSILHEKSKGLEAYAKYMKDAEDNDEVMQLIQRIREQDRKQVQELRNCLADVIRGTGM